MNVFTGVHCCTQFEMTTMKLHVSKTKMNALFCHIMYDLEHDLDEFDFKFEHVFSHKY